MEFGKRKELKKLRFMILGANGQLGKEFRKELASQGFTYDAPEEKECDITRFDEMNRMIDALGPDVIINCAAFNAVDNAEKDRELADLINHRAVGNLAGICGKNGTVLVHYGTDYVFDGSKGDFYNEEDEPHPLNVYGTTKLAGENAVLSSSAPSLVFRPSWVYGDGTQNFIHKLLGWASKNRILKISGDEVSIPTSTRVIVKATLKLVEDGSGGLYHLTNSDYCSRYEWCRFVLETLRLTNIVIPVPMADFNLPARRPVFVPMSNGKAQKALGYSIPHWKTSLGEYLRDSFVSGNEPVSA